MVMELCEIFAGGVWWGVCYLLLQGNDSLRICLFDFISLFFGVHGVFKWCSGLMSPDWGWTSVTTIEYLPICVSSHVKVR